MSKPLCHLQGDWYQQNGVSHLWQRFHLHRWILPRWEHKIMIKYFAMSDYYILVTFVSINMLTLEHCLSYQVSRRTHFFLCSFAFLNLWEKQLWPNYLENNCVSAIIEVLVILQMAPLWSIGTFWSSAHDAISGNSRN